MKIHTQILIFKGGGYDGCIWEWNALFFTKGKLDEDQPAVSGRSGEAAVAVVKANGTYKGVRDIVGGGGYTWGNGRPDQIHIVRNEDEWKEFCKEFNAGFVRNVAKHCQYDMLCDKCKGMFSPDEIVHTGYRGDGGIGVQFDDNLCTECADEAHDEYVEKYVWPHLSYKEKKEIIERVNGDGAEIPLSKARCKKHMPVMGREVCEPEYY